MYGRAQDNSKKFFSWRLKEDTGDKVYKIAEMSEGHWTLTAVVQRAIDELYEKVVNSRQA